MTSYSKPRNWVAGQAITAAALNADLRDNMKNIDERLTLHGITSESALNKVKAAVCGTRLSDTTDQSIAEGTEATLSWDTEDYDSDGFHDAGLPARITIPAGLGGYYLVSTAIRWQSNPGGSRSLWVEDDTGLVLGRVIDGAASGTFTHQTLTFLALLSAGDYIISRVGQDGSSATLTAATTIVSAFFGAWRIFAT